MQDYYYVLGIDKDASILEIEKAYERLSQKYSLHKNDGDKFYERLFEDIQEAYEILKDPQRKKDYDISIKNLKGSKINILSNVNSVTGSKEKISKKRNNQAPFKDPKRKQSNAIISWVIFIFLIMVVSSIIYNDYSNKSSHSKSYANSNQPSHLNKSSFTEGRNNLFKSPEATIEEFFNRINNDDWEGAYMLCDNELWKPFSNFSENAWGGYSRLVIQDSRKKNYNSKYGGTDIIEITFSGYDQNSSKLIKNTYDFHFKKQKAGGWKIVRMVFPKQEEWYEDDPDFDTRNDTWVNILNRPYVLLQKYYDNFSKAELTKNNLDLYNDILFIHHEKELITKEEAVNRDFIDFRNNNVLSYQILVKPSSMITNKYENIDIVYVPLMYYVTKTNGERSKFSVDITAVLDKSNQIIYAIGTDISTDRWNKVIELYKSGNDKAQYNDKTTLNHGDSPYEYCYGNENSCSYNCSFIRVKASYNSDVIVLVKKSENVVRNAFIEKGRTYEFELPNGTYQAFFYFGTNWNNKKYMKESSCGQLFGGFTTDEHFSKDTPQYLSNNILTYELVLQTNGNFSTRPSNINEVF